MVCPSAIVGGARFAPPLVEWFPRVNTRTPSVVGSSSGLLPTSTIAPATDVYRRIALCGRPKSRLGPCGKLRTRYDEEPNGMGFQMVKFSWLRIASTHQDPLPASFRVAVFSTNSGHGPYVSLPLAGLSYLTRIRSLSIAFPAPRPPPVVTVSWGITDWFTP